MDNGGWIKLHRKTLKSPVVMKDGTHLALWVYLLLNASHNDHDVLFGGRRITLHPGELTTTFSQIAKDLGANVSTVKRALDDFERETQIETRRERYGTLISVKKWDLYQIGETPVETRVKHETNANGTKSETPSETPLDLEKPFISGQNRHSEPQVRNTVCNTSETPVKHERNTYQEYKELKNIYIESARAREQFPCQKPTLDEVKIFCSQFGLKFMSPELFFNYYDARGWKINGQPMENWKAAARAWDERDKKKNRMAGSRNKFAQIETHDYDFADLERQLLGE